MYLEVQDFIKFIPLRNENQTKVKQKSNECVVNAEGQVEYKIEDGIFKRICHEAGKRSSPSLSFDDAFEQFVDEVESQGEKFELKTIVQEKPFNVKMSSLGNCRAIPKTKDAPEMTITKSNLKAYIENGVIKSWKSYITTIGE